MAAAHDEFRFCIIDMGAGVFHNPILTLGRLVITLDGNDGIAFDAGRDGYVRQGKHERIVGRHAVEAGRHAFAHRCRQLDLVIHFQQLCGSVHQLAGKGDETIQEAGARMFDYILKVASGEEIISAVRNGQDDFIPWKRGVSL